MVEFTEDYAQVGKGAKDSKLANRTVANPENNKKGTGPIEGVVKGRECVQRLQGRANCK